MEDGTLRAQTSGSLILQMRQLLPIAQIGSPGPQSRPKLTMMDLLRLLISRLTKALILIMRFHSLHYDINLVFIWLSR